jgi:hypothetical protein
LGASDAAIAILRGIYAREMTAFDEGRPGRRFEKAETATLARIDASD